MGGFLCTEELWALRALGRPGFAAKIRSLSFKQKGQTPRRACLGWK
jgi:hypothetical protein